MWKIVRKCRIISFNFYDVYVCKDLIFFEKLIEKFCLEFGGCIKDLLNMLLNLSIWFWWNIKLMDILM